MLEYTLKRMKRKTLSAHVLDDGTVEVRAPYGVSKAFIDAFVAENEEKLKGYVNDRILKNARRSTFEVKVGSRLLFMGDEYTVAQGDGRIEIADGKFYVSGDNVKAQVIGLYKGYARKILNDKVAKYSRIMGLYPKSVGVGGAKTRWGSCSSRGTITFSWYLIMASEAAVDYVVIHELAHLKYMNHSREFWRLVECCEPNYTARRKELKRLSERLAGEIW